MLIYPYAVGKDPRYDAFKARSDYERAIAEQDAELRRRRTDEAYQRALADLDARGAVDARAINTAMLQRGVYSSGETSRRQAELQAALLRARGEAEATRAARLGEVSSDLQRALTMLDLANQREIADAMERIAAAESQVAREPAGVGAGRAAAASPGRATAVGPGGATSGESTVPLPLQVLGLFPAAPMEPPRLRPAPARQALPPSRYGYLRYS